jgi:DNA repair photolyase
MNPIYNPKGAAKEYCEWALNIYTGCPHRCFYCYCPQILRRDKEDFFTRIEPRKNIVEETRKQLERDGIAGKLIQLCFIGDPFPTGYDTSATREIIQLLKEHGNHVQILTKGDGSRDFDLLDENDWYGVTIDGKFPIDMYFEKMDALKEAHRKGIKTWVSFEPVLDAENVLNAIEFFFTDYDKAKIGKLNYYPSNIDWKSFGERAEALCKDLGVDYYIKDSLRKEMEKP